MRQAQTTSRPISVISTTTFYEKTYEEDKEENKLELGVASLIMFKSCVGLGMFSYPYIFSLAGIALSTFLSTVICYFTTYGMYCLSYNTRIVETNILKSGKRVNDYNGITILNLILIEVLCNILGKETYGELLGKILGYLSIAGTLLNNVGCVNSILIESGKFSSNRIFLIFS